MISQDLTQTAAQVTGLSAPAPLPLEQEGARFESWLRLWLPVRYALTVTFTSNLSTLLSYRRGTGHVALRLHRLFAAAGPDVAQAVSLYVVGKKGHEAALRDYLGHIQRALQTHARPPLSLRSTGAVHDLLGMYHRLNAQEFSGRCTAAITWGRASPSRRRKRSITLGSYHAAQNLIRIHPCLDQTFVPAYVVQGVVHHEMLHEIMGIEERNGRRRIHPPEFVAIERMYVDYDRCTAWERAHIGRLLALCP